jgi:hypothetical protein
MLPVLLIFMLILMVEQHLPCWRLREQRFIEKWGINGRVSCRYIVDLSNLCFCFHHLICAFPYMQLVFNLEAEIASGAWSCINGEFTTT